MEPEHPSARARDRRLSKPLGAAVLAVAALPLTGQSVTALTVEVPSVARPVLIPLGLAPPQAVHGAAALTRSRGAARVRDQVPEAPWRPVVDRLEERLAADVAADGVGSVTAGVIVGNDLVWARGFGLADRDRSVPADANTIYRTGSISKSFTAVLLARLVERGVVALDDPVERYLPEVRGLAERPPGTAPITLRQLASHTAGLIREPELEGAAAGPIEEWEERVLASIPATRFQDPPGHRYAYSNVGFGILGLALSRAAGVPFMDLVTDEIIRPAGMTQTAFIVTPAIETKLASGYANREGGIIDAELPALEHRGRGYKVPNGGVYSTVRDLGLFIAAVSGALPVEILTPESRERMRTVQTPESEPFGYGLGFFVYREPDGGPFVGHTGSVAGYSAFLAFEPETRVGIVLLRNYNQGATGLRDTGLATLAELAAGIRASATEWRAGPTPEFEPFQSDAFRGAGALATAWADYDGDGDPDRFAGFRGRPNRLYRNDGGSFTDVADEAGVADLGQTRAAAWGDFDGDGWLDLYVGFAGDSTRPNRLYRSRGDGTFEDVAPAMGAALVGATRQASWIDYDRDGDVDLFVALRDGPNALFRNDGGRLVDVASAAGIADGRRSVGAVWLDYDRDGDLDLFVANMDGDANGLFRNDDQHFVDVASLAGVDGGGRPPGSGAFGSVRPCVVDYDNDGALDLFLANYGTNGLFRNVGGGKFDNVAPELGLAVESRWDTCAWGDVDHDGRPDLYVNGTVTGGVQYPDYLFLNGPDRFHDRTSASVRGEAASHGAHWVDADGDGDLDLGLAGAAPEATHVLLRNLLPAERASRSLQVLVLDGRGRFTRAGSEVRLYDTATGALLGTRLVDTGSGYNAQNALPVHFGIPTSTIVDVEVTVMSPGGRRAARVEGVDPADQVGRALVVKVTDAGSIVP